MTTKTVEIHEMALDLFNVIRDVAGYPKPGDEVDLLADLRMELFWEMSERWEGR